MLTDHGADVMAAAADQGLAAAADSAAGGYERRFIQRLHVDRRQLEFVLKGE